MITLDSIDYPLHSIQIKDNAGDALAIGADGSLNITDNGGSLTVDAVNLDIRDLAFATDKVDVTGSEVSLDSATLAALESITVQNGSGAAAVNIQDGGNSITVDGTVAISGTVAVTQSTTPWDVALSTALPAGTNNIGDVDVLSLPGGLRGYAEDAAHTSGDFGAMVLGVRQDTAASLVGASGDYAPFQLDAIGNVKVGIFDAAGDQLAISAAGAISAGFTEAGYSSWSVVAASIDDTVGGTQLVSSPLSGRLRVEIQNLGSADIYIRQSTGVTTSNGLKIPKGSSFEQALDAGAAIYAITPSGTADLRIAQYAA